METIQQQIGAMQEDIKRLREELKEVKKGNFVKVTCKGWMVVDEDGNERISAGTFSNGSAGVKWIDKGGKVRIEADTDDICASLLFSDYKGKGRILALTVLEDASVQLLDKDGKNRIEASTSIDSKYAGVVWRDKDEKVRINAAATFVDGTAGVFFNDKDGKIRIEATISPDGTVNLPTKDENPPKKP